MHEIYLNTPDQSRGYLREALAIVEELDPPEDLRAIVFAKAVDHIAQKNVTIDPSDMSRVSVPAMAIPRGR